MAKKKKTEVSAPEAPKDGAQDDGAENDSALVVHMSIMDRPPVPEPLQKEDPAVELKMTVMEKPRPERNLKEGAPKADVQFVTKLMQPKRKRAAAVRSIGSTYPQGRKG